VQGSNPIYNLLPDILSQLSAEADLPAADFQAIMRHLLQYIGKEKHADSIVDKLCARFEATENPSHWRNLTFCLAQVRYK
jgi:condensin complex subunit 1